MYSQHLKTFLEVAKEQSFSKASKKLYMTTTAVVKQMNMFEEEMGCQLFIRTNHGIKLTNEGKLLQEEGEYIVDYTNHVKSHLQESMNKEYCLRIGSSLLCPHDVINEYWPEIQRRLPNYTINIIPFSDSVKNTNIKVASKIGQNYDIVITEADSFRYLNYYNFCLLGYYDLCVTVPRNHPLAKKEILTFDDFRNQTLTMCRKGDSRVIDELRNDILTYYPDITIENTNFFYDMETFNSCVNNNQILISLDGWKNIHPALVEVKVDWDYKMPYGIMYTKDCPKELKNVISIIEELVKDKN